MLTSCSSSNFVPSAVLAGNIPAQPDRSASTESHSVVRISPPGSVRRYLITRHGMAIESVQCTAHDEIECQFRAQMHLLVAYMDGDRRGGETLVDGLQRSTLRNYARKFTFVPAGHEFHERHAASRHTRFLYLYVDVASLSRFRDREHILRSTFVLRRRGTVAYGQQIGGSPPTPIDRRSPLSSRRSAPCLCTSLCVPIRENPASNRRCAEVLRGGKSMR